MIALLQRVSQARVEVAGECLGAIDAGLLVLVCAEVGDTDAEADRMADKLLALRVFADDAGKMNRSVADLGGGMPGGVLIVPQFTLAADTRCGNRPSFGRAAPAEPGRKLYERLLARLRARHPRVEAGRYGAHMQVALVNDGPVTIPLVLRGTSA